MSGAGFTTGQTGGRNFVLPHAWGRDGTHLERATRTTLAVLASLRGGHIPSSAGGVQAALVEEGLSSGQIGQPEISTALKWLQDRGTANAGRARVEVRDRDTGGTASQAQDVWFLTEISDALGPAAAAAEAAPPSEPVGQRTDWWNIGAPK